MIRKFTPLVIYFLVTLPSFCMQNRITLLGVGKSSAAVTGITFTGNTCLTADNGTTCAFGSNVTSGNLILCGGGIYNSAANPATGDFTDTRSTTLTVTQWGPGPVAQRLVIVYGVLGSGGADTVTLGTHAGAQRNFGCGEFTGQNANPFDANGTNSTGTSMAPSSAITPVAATVLVVGVMSHISGASTLTPGTGFLQIAEQESVANDPFNFEYKLNVSGATNATWTTGASVNWTASSMSFK